MIRASGKRRGTRVYRVRRDPRYRALVLAPDAAALVFDGSVREEPWPLLRVEADDARLPLGHFVHWHPGALVAAPSIPDEVVWGFFEMSGQTFALEYLGRGFTALNVTECINCLDQDATAWAFDATTGQQTDIVRYVFHPRRFSSSSIFKIPETAEREVLVVERTRDAEQEFKRFVEKARLTGLIFEELWSEA